MEKTEAGLIVPDGTMERKKRVMRKDAFTKMRRAMQALDEEGLGTVVGCKDCNTPISAALTDRLDPRVRGGGRIVVLCKCSEREVR